MFVELSQKSQVMYKCMRESVLNSGSLNSNDYADQSPLRQILLSLANRMKCHCMFTRHRASARLWWRIRVQGGWCDGGRRNIRLCRLHSRLSYFSRLTFIVRESFNVSFMFVWIISAASREFLRRRNCRRLENKARTRSTRTNGSPTKWLR